jgi:hypothetical protein
MCFLWHKQISKEDHRVQVTTQVQRLDSLLSHKNPSASDEPDTLICTHLTANDPLSPLLEVERNVVDRD